MPKKTEEKNDKNFLISPYKSLLKCLLRLYFQAHYKLCRESLNQLEKHLLPYLFPKIHVLVFDNKPVFILINGSYLMNQALQLY